ncbi:MULTISPECIES: cation:proton antiporter [unclassified Methylobacterium]|jgi:CPA1 family monovalent cation:H+ antiporter|uniref:cation:proton antiporter n=1 Tax=unclassified Methylobacterium TaxID=2615210 RepID=UPI001355B23A|nr:sodium:proton antiporter [Methylobacterium sp. 2A]MWV26036.1 sodium:proton antiporter [Methylobacterium sp. 2A]
MLIFEWVVGVLFGAVLLAGLARRLGAPYPAFLALGGIGLAFVPGVPNLRLDPELALALFLAPVLLDAGFDASVRDMKVNWRPILGLAVGAVVVTTLAVAIVARLIVPDMPFSACIVLGAVVAPPDAVAALAVLKHAPMPHRLATILRGESLLNDAASLLIYRLAVAAAMAGSFHPAEVAPAFLLGVVASLLVGPGLGLLFVALTRRVTDPASAIVMQFVVAFGIWLAAERLELSGVLTIVAFAVTVARKAPGVTAPRARVISYAVWDTAVFVLNVLAFVLIGIQIGPIQERLSGADAWQALILAAATFATVVVTRLAWVMPTTGLRGFGLRQAGARARLGPGLALSWAGMRGIVTVAAALALPAEFPRRDLVVVAAFVTVLGTLVVQGLTLRPLLAHLKLEDDDPVGRETGRARAAAYKAALDSLAEAEDEPATDALRAEFRAALAEAEEHEEGRAPESLPADAARRRAVEAARDAVLTLRRGGRIGDDAYYLLEEEFDWAELSATPKAET